MPALPSLTVVLALLRVLPLLAAPAHKAATPRGPKTSELQSSRTDGLGEEREVLEAQLAELRAEIKGLKLAASGNTTHCKTTKRTRLDTKSIWAHVAPEGTPCVFGVDAADEDKHCVRELEYGSFGWCWTKEDKSQWGSCGYGCPLVGKPKILGKRLDRTEHMMKQLTAAVHKVIGKFKHLRGEEPPCTTIGSDGVGAGHRCIFPFKYKFETYNSCTQIDHTAMWCYIAVDETGRGIGGEWGVCPPLCHPAEPVAKEAAKMPDTKSSKGDEAANTTTSGKDNEKVAKTKKGGKHEEAAADEKSATAKPKVK